jgi:hypothetical protein
MAGKRGQLPDEDEYLLECLKIEPLALSEEFIRLPGDFAYWAGKYATATEDYLKAKAGCEHEYARLYLLAGQKVNPASGKPYTVEALKSLVEVEDDYQAAHLAEIEAEVTLTKAKNTLEAIRTKRDMAVQLGAQVRQEMQADPLTRDRSSRR